MDSYGKANVSYNKGYHKTKTAFINKIFSYKNPKEVWQAFHHIINPSRKQAKCE